MPFEVQNLSKARAGEDEQAYRSCRMHVDFHNLVLHLLRSVLHLLCGIGRPSDADCFSLGDGCAKATELVWREVSLTSFLAELLDTAGRVMCRIA